MDLVCMFQDLCNIISYKSMKFDVLALADIKVNVKKVNMLNELKCFVCSILLCVCAMRVYL